MSFKAINNQDSIGIWLDNKNGFKGIYERMRGIVDVGLMNSELYGYRTNVRK